MLGALAWFIANDDTYSGGEWEEGNVYWLQHRRAALALFENHKQFSEALGLFQTLVSNGQAVTLTEAEEDQFYELDEET